MPSKKEWILLWVLFLIPLVLWLGLGFSFIGVSLFGWGIGFILWALTGWMGQGKWSPWIPIAFVLIGIGLGIGKEVVAGIVGQQEVYGYMLLVMLQLAVVILGNSQTILTYAKENLASLIPIEGICILVVLGYGALQNRKESLTLFGGANWIAVLLLLLVYILQHTGRRRKWRVPIGAYLGGAIVLIGSSCLVTIVSPAVEVLLEQVLEKQSVQYMSDTLAYLEHQATLEGFDSWEEYLKKQGSSGLRSDIGDGLGIFFSTAVAMESSLVAAERISLTNEYSNNPQVLFKGIAEQPLLLRKKAYATYEDSAFVLSDSQQEGEERYYPVVMEEPEPLDVLLNLLEEMADASIPMPPGIQEALDSPIVPFREKSLSLFNVSANDSTVLTANGVLNIERLDYAVEMQMNMGTLETKSIVDVVQQGNYWQSYRDKTLQKDSQHYALMRFVTGGELGQLEGLWRQYIKQQGMESASKWLALQRCQDAYTEAKDTYLQLPPKWAGSIEQLTQSITNTCDNDLERAMAIEQFLKWGNYYEYDKSLTTPKEGIDNLYFFLFEEKRGICQQFAGAMTLMCRSIGIPSRYVVGYRMAAQDEAGYYVVRGGDAHAFVEVYLPVYGWMSFDPTAYDRSDEENARMQESKWDRPIWDIEEKVVLAKKSMDNFLGIIAFLVGVFVVSYSYTRRKKWVANLARWHEQRPCLTRGRVMRLSRQRRLVVLMYHALKVLKKKGYEKDEKERLHTYGERLASLGIEGNRLIELVERQQYGGILPSEKEVEEAWQIYEKICQLPKEKTKGGTNNV